MVVKITRENIFKMPSAMPYNRRPEQIIKNNNTFWRRGYEVMPNPFSEKKLNGYIHPNGSLFNQMVLLKRYTTFGIPKHICWKVPCF